MSLKKYVCRVSRYLPLDASGHEDPTRCHRPTAIGLKGDGSLPQSLQSIQ